MKYMIKITMLVYVLLMIAGCDRNSSTEMKFEEIPFPEGAKAILPHLTSSGGQLYLSWVDTLTDTDSKLLYTRLQENKWLPPTLLTSGANWFVNWADYPMVAAHNGKLLSHYLVRSSNNKMAYDIKFSMSDGTGGQSGKYQTLHNDHTATEHGFVSMIPYRDSSFLVAWLDGRNMVSEGHDHTNGHHTGAMSVRAAEITSSGEIKDEHILDDSACTCCQTTASLTSNGPVVLYRDCTADNIRDIVIVRKVADKWTKPIPIHRDNWFIQGCPVNGPKSVALDNTLAVAWYTGADENPRVQLVFSDNGGAQFDTPILISKDGVLGRVDVVLIDAEQAIVSWMQAKGDKTSLYAMKINKKGKKGPAHIVTPLSSSRKSGFPQMEIVGDRVYFAWMDINEKGNILKTASKEICQF